MAAIGRLLPFKSNVLRLVERPLSVEADVQNLAPEKWNANDHEKRYNSIHQRRSLLNVLHRSIEIATLSGHFAETNIIRYCRLRVS